jgi:hypothetical protein
MEKYELIQSLQLDLEVIEKEMGANEMSIEDACRLVQAKRVTVKSLIELGAFDEH